MNYYLFLAILSPIIWALMNVIDKYVVSHHVKKPLGFAVYTIFANVIFGIVLAFFLDWTGIPVSAFIWPLIVGILGGFNFYFYYWMMSKGDASHIVGLVYLYPILVLILSFLFLGEKMVFAGYVGSFLIIIGALILSVRLQKARVKIAGWFFALFIINTAVWEFSIKVMTNHMPAYNGVAAASIVNVLLVIPLLFSARIRKEFVYEVRHAAWALVTEFFTVLAVVTLYVSMAGLKASVVSSLAAIQPLAVLLFEKIAHGLFGKMVKDVKILPKLGAIILIVLGLILLSFYSG